MYLKKLFVIFPVIYLLPVLSTTSSAATGAAQPEQASASASHEIGEPAEKIEEVLPFCSANFLLKSDFVRTSVWPGIGPFDVVAPKESDSSGSNKSVQLADPSHNQLSCTTNGNEISACELELHNNIGEAQGLLNLQMSTDFLLEGLGVKPRQIHIVNMELSKKSKLLTGNNYNPISVIIAPLTVSFQNLGKKEGTVNPLFRVAILNQSQHSEKLGTTEQTSNNVNVEENKSGEIDTANLPETSNNKPETITPDKVEPKIGSVPETKTSSNKPLSKDEMLKKQFLELITNWQHIKKTAVMEHQTNELSHALAGKALVKQSDGIKWLAANHKYYEMVSQSATVEHFDSLVPQKKYAVFAEVKEKSKFMDESTKKQLKETDDIYKVNYTIEKIGQHWLITDSALIKQGTKKPVTKPSANKRAG